MNLSSDFGTSTPSSNNSAIHFYKNRDYYDAIKDEYRSDYESAEAPIVSNAFSPFEYYPLLLSHKDTATLPTTEKNIFVETSLKEKLDELESYGIEWFDQDIPIGPSKEVIADVRDLIPDFVDNDIIPFRIAPSIEEGLCLVFRNKDIFLYLEFYNDGDIGLIAEDRKKKSIIANIDLTKQDVIKWLRTILD